MEMVSPLQPQPLMWRPMLVTWRYCQANMTLFLPTPLKTQQPMLKWKLQKEWAERSSLEKLLTSRPTCHCLHIDFIFGMQKLRYLPSFIVHQLRAHLLFQILQKIRWQALIMEIKITFMRQVVMMHRRNSLKSCPTWMKWCGISTKATPIGFLKGKVASATGANTCIAQKGCGWKRKLQY